MRSILFHVPMQVTIGPWTLPLFGWGILLAAWALGGGVAILRAARRQGFAAAAAGLGPSLAIVGAVVLWVAPALADAAGVPVRGYGVMLLAAAAAGTWLSVRRGRAAGFEADTILGLGLWIFVAGLVGARLFFVIEYHAEFFRPGEPLAESLARAAFVPNGGLVVFGALPTAGLAAWWYARRHGLPLLRLADVIAPGLLLGLAIGRVGCFLNGCCYGGPTDLPWAVSFPPESPPWLDQVQRGLLPEPAAGSAPPWTLPVHPAQLYAAIDAALLAAVACAVTPVFRREGAVFALVLTLHPLSRILLEIIRVDEKPALGTPLSISQLVSVVLLGLAGVLWWWVCRDPGTARPFDGGRPRASH
ncbi:MAG: prolipoprotein diacylglyceryl transferase [Planctomycetaceae bacterium]